MALNESEYALAVAAVLETDENDDKIATELAIIDPKTREETQDLRLLDELLVKKQVQDPKELFYSILKALEDLRPRVPPLLSISANHIFVNEKTG